jgi:cytidine deaminase
LQKIFLKMIAKNINISFSILEFDEIEPKFQNLIKLAKHQTAKSYAPYSNFNVGAAVLLENGEIFTGNNQENAASPSCLCAERVAMFYANAQHPDSKPIAIAIAARNADGFLQTPISPCGGCRQVLLETELRYKSDIKVLLYGEKSVFALNSIKLLLPLAFSQEQL